MNKQFSTFFVYLTQYQFFNQIIKRKRFFDFLIRNSNIVLSQSRSQRKIESKQKQNKIYISIRNVLIVRFCVQFYINLYSAYSIWFCLRFAKCVNQFPVKAFLNVQNIQLVQQKVRQQAKQTKMSNRKTVQTALVFLCLVSCLGATLLPSNPTIKAIELGKDLVEPLPKIKITLDVLLQAKRSGNLDELELYADQLNIEDLLAELKVRYNSMIEAKKVLKTVTKSASNLKARAQPVGYATGPAKMFSETAVMNGEQIVNNWGSFEKDIVTIWVSGQKEGNKLRMLQVRRILHIIVDIICDRLGCS